MEQVRNIATFCSTSVQDVNGRNQCIHHCLVAHFRGCMLLHRIQTCLEHADHIRYVEVCLALGAFGHSKKQAAEERPGGSTVHSENRPPQVVESALQVMVLVRRETSFDSGYSASHTDSMVAIST